MSPLWDNSGELSASMVLAHTFTGVALDYIYDTVRSNIMLLLCCVTRTIRAAGWELLMQSCHTQRGSLSYNHIHNSHLGNFSGFYCSVNAGNLLGCYFSLVDIYNSSFPVYIYQKPKWYIDFWTKNVMLKNMTKMIKICIH